MTPHPLLLQQQRKIFVNLHSITIPIVNGEEKRRIERFSWRSVSIFILLKPIKRNWFLCIRCICWHSNVDTNGWSSHRPRVCHKNIAFFWAAASLVCARYFECPWMTIKNRFVIFFCARSKLSKKKWLSTRLRHYHFENVSLLLSSPVRDMIFQQIYINLCSSFSCVCLSFL